MNTTVYPIIGMSPGNSYFTYERIVRLLEITAPYYEKVIIFIPDIPAIHTYCAYDYPENLARRKAVAAGNMLRNRVRRAMHELSLSGERIIIVDWNRDVKDSESYNACRESVVRLYNESGLFRNDTRETTKSLLVNSGREINDYEKAIDRAVQYLLEEFAFIQFIRLHMGCENVKYIYHRPWPVYERYIAGIYDKTPKPELRFEISSIF